LSFGIYGLACIEWFLENGQSLPSTKTLLRYAEATGSKFHVRLSAA
jgi:hypothetical protein